MPINTTIMKNLFGFDLGGTKIEGVVLESATSTLPLARLRVPTEAEGGYHHIISQIVKLKNMLAKETGIEPEALGICTPGTYDPISRLQKNSNTTCLNDKPFLDNLTSALGLPVRMANDANCFALAEARLGSVGQWKPDAEVVFGIIMGTGVGGGLVVHSKVVNGAMGIAGEWGHNFLDESGGPCYCGRGGCVETVLAGPSLERYYHQISGNQLKLKAIMELAEKGDAKALEVKQRLIHFFGKAVGVLINILDPDAIVIGGGVGNIDFLYQEGVKEVEKYLFNPRLDTRFFKPTLGDSAGVFGAAMLWG